MKGPNFTDLFDALKMTVQLRIRSLHYRGQRVTYS